MAIDYVKGDIVRLVSGETCKIVGTPNEFMSNGSYEIVLVDMTLGGKCVEEKMLRKIWVKPTQIAYKMTNDEIEINISQFLEIISDNENSIKIIPKGPDMISIIEDDQGFKTLRLAFGDKNNVDVLIGKNVLIDKKDGEI